MSARMKWFILFVSTLFGILSLSNYTVFASDGVTLYTPYTKISVPPGESIDYVIDVINSSDEVKNVDISLAGIPKGWNYVLKSGAWTISQLSILPGGSKTFL